MPDKDNHRRSRSNCRSALVSMLILCVVSSFSWSVEAQVASQAMPDLTFYPLVFRHVLFLQHRELQETSNPSESVHSFYSKRLLFTDDEMQIMLRVAQAFSAAIAPIDTQAATLIKTTRSRYPGGRVPAGQDPPPIPQQLYELQAQHDAIVSAHIAMLKSAVGLKRFAVLDKSLRTTMQPTYQKQDLGSTLLLQNPLVSAEVTHD